MEENNEEVRAVVDMIMPGKKPRREMDGMRPMRYVGTADHRWMPRIEHSGNQDFWATDPTSLENGEEAESSLYRDAIAEYVIKVIIAGARGYFGSIIS